jgi:hypothetical protein
MMFKLLRAYPAPRQHARGPLSFAPQHPAEQGANDGWQAHCCPQAIDAELDLTDKGLGLRSRRYAMLVDDGVVKVLNMEEGGAFTVSSAEDIIATL